MDHTFSIKKCSECTDGRVPCGPDWGPVPGAYSGPCEACGGLGKRAVIENEEEVIYMSFKKTLDLLMQSTRPGDLFVKVVKG